MEVVKKERKENLRKKLVFQVSGAHKGQNREEKSVYQNSVAEPIELCMILWSPSHLVVYVRSFYYLGKATKP